MVPQLARVACSFVGDEHFQGCVVFALVVVLAVARVGENTVDGVVTMHHLAVLYTTRTHII